MIFKVGCHVSIAGSLEKSVERAENIGCTTFQIFTGNPRGWNAKDISEKDVGDFTGKLENSHISPVVAHMPYLPNLATPKPDLYKKSCDVLIREIERCSLLKVPYLVTHLGSHLGKGRDEGVQRTVEALSGAVESVKSDVMILLENTAGTKNSIGGTLEDIGEILDTAGKTKRIGTCFDTCHAFAAGYDLSTEKGFNETISGYDTCIGLDRLKVVHLNDAKGECNSRLDRHEHIGLGKIGDEGLKRVVNHPKLRELAFILETPVDKKRGDIENVSHARELFDE
ncbi:deoxyribonuclease-4 [Methanomicrobium sp. W14]|jgi:deoxyribonuclease-4|uniref:deoxyribonuclease IV n=1 Tax=Methanomicrobium sp. W14 TaxID=2817839 RepID=UPI001FD95837|nr:deoxyribonuclease IV [Methanomicrobium sp. W14]MBP2134082.1 deoxyribonuclease-4 [Methanomicrobium sp. W14]